MSEFAPLGLFCLFASVLVALIVVIAVYGYLQAEKRKKELADWARGHRWHFTPNRDYHMDGRYPGFSCLQQGSERYAYNIVSGAHNGRGLTAFDYHYETYSTDSKGRRQTHHHYFSAVVLDTEFHLQPLSIRGETLLDKVGEFLGFDDIDFESAEFSREFHVKCKDRKWAFDVIQQSTMEFLLQSPRFAVQFDERSVIASQGATFSVATFDNALAVVEGILERIPPGLQKELRRDE
jgi:hypothetical protein